MGGPDRGSLGRGFRAGGLEGVSGPGPEEQPGERGTPVISQPREVWGLLNAA